MQRLFSILSLFLGLSFFVSCSEKTDEIKPDNTETEQGNCTTENFGFPVNTCKPETIIYTQNVNGTSKIDTITFKYDGQNRLTEAFNLVNMGSTRYIKYTYFADSVQEDSYNSFPATAANFVGRLTFYIDGNC